MNYSPEVLTIAQTIQLSLSPVFMLAGIGALLNVLAGRLSRVIDRARALENLLAQGAGRETGRDQTRHARELRLLDGRMKIINRALFLAVSSAVMTCAVVATLFVGVLASLHIGQLVGIAFILAMLLLIASLSCFMIEVSKSMEANRVPDELMH